MAEAVVQVARPLALRRPCFFLVSERRESREGDGAKDGPFDLVLERYERDLGAGWIEKDVAVHRDRKRGKRVALRRRRRFRRSQLTVVERYGHAGRRTRIREGRHGRQDRRRRHGRARRPRTGANDRRALRRVTDGYRERQGPRSVLCTGHGPANGRDGLQDWPGRHVRSRRGTCGRARRGRADRRRSVVMVIKDGAVTAIDRRMAVHQNASRRRAIVGRRRPTRSRRPDDVIATRCRRRRRRRWHRHRNRLRSSGSVRRSERTRCSSHRRSRREGLVSFRQSWLSQLAMRM